jgi:lysozyme
MISRRGVVHGLAGLMVPTLAGCGGTPSRTPVASLTAGAYPPPALSPDGSWRPAVDGLDAVIDISHNVQVSDFRAVRSGGVLAVIHKTSEGGDWFDPSYASRRREAEQAGLLWGGYHFGTRQYSGARQAEAFLSAARPGPTTLLALDYELNDSNPANTMRISQAEDFVQVIYRATGRFPVVYTDASWANGERVRRGIRPEPVNPNSILAQCDLWLADFHEQPEVPYAWADRGWRLWQYVANESVETAAYGAQPRAIPGITHCDRNLFAGDETQLARFWRSSGRAGV